MSTYKPNKIKKAKAKQVTAATLGPKDVAVPFFPPLPSSLVALSATPKLMTSMQVISALDLVMKLPLPG
jgi:hypothetical protein